MLPTHSPYSPFFTSGLFNRPLEPDVPLSPRRGSLPTDSHVSAFYFTLQHHHHGRSFLSLDLAESQSMRSKSTSNKSYRFPCISEPASAAPLRRPFSRDSLRTIPSPKPAPSITLPDVPKIPSTPPRLPSIHLTPALDLFPAVPAPAQRVPDIQCGRNDPKLLPRLRLELPPAFRRVSVATTSTVSTRARVQNRSDALARLEGRVRRPNTAPLPKRNFMSMSDDEDDADDSDTDSPDAADADDDLSELDADSVDLPLLDFPDPRFEPEDVVLPLPSPPVYLEAPRSAPLPPRPSPPRRTSTKRASLTGDGAPLRRQRTRTRKTPASAGSAADWAPLKSFIDLRTEPASDPPTARKRDSARTKSSSSRSSAGATWMWRSFIELAHVA